jgi:hypothetical protein
MQDRIPFPIRAAGAKDHLPKLMTGLHLIEYNR